jgi:signal transduction histidine kinase
MTTLLPSVITIFYIIFLGIFVSLKSNNDRLYRPFSGFLVSLAIWKLGDIFFLTVVGSALTVDFGLRFTYIGGILAPAFFLTLVCCLCKVSLKSLRVLYASTAVFLLLNFFTDLFVKKIFFIPETLTLQIKTGMAYPYFLAEVALVLIISMGVILVRRNKVKGYERDQLTFFLVSVCLLSAAIISYVLIMNNLLIARLDTVFLIFFLSVISFSITKHNLVDADALVTKVGSKGIAILVVIFSLFILNMFDSIYHFGKPLYGVATLFWCLWFEKMSLLIQTPLEKKFLKGSYNADDVVKHLAMNLVKSETYTDVFYLLSKTIEQWLETKPLGFCCVSNDEESFRLVQHGDDISMRSEDPVINLFRGLTSYVGVGSLNESDQHLLVALGCRKESYCFPVHTPLGFRGVLFVHKKLSENEFNDRDLELLEALSKQVINVLDRINHKVLLEKSNEELEQKVSDQVSEIESAMKMAEKSSKHASFGQLLMGIAHEVRNPLQAILGSVGLIDENSDDKEAVSMLVKSSIDNIHRLINIMETLLQYGKPSSGEKKDVLISDIVNDFLHLKEINLSTSGITLTKQYETIATIKADDNRVYQVVSNIITNAIEAMPDGGTLTIHIFDGEYIDKSNEKRKGVCFSVVDTGVGISDDEKEKMFDSFFTTKYGNTGLGLPMVLQIIDDHEGMISIDSVKGEGTSFNIFFPR